MTWVPQSACQVERGRAGLSGGAMRLAIRKPEQLDAAAIGMDNARAGRPAGNPAQPDVAVIGQRP